MRSIKVHEAKTNLSKLIEQACRGKEVIIARGTIPVVRLIPIGEVGPEFFEPLPADELSAWE